MTLAPALIVVLSRSATADVLFDNYGGDASRLDQGGALSAFRSTTFTDVYTVPATRVVFDKPALIDRISTVLTIRNTDGTNGDPAALTRRIAGAFREPVDRFFADPFAGDIFVSVETVEDDFINLGLLPDGIAIHYLVTCDLPDFEVAAGESWWFATHFEKPGDFTFDVPEILRVGGLSDDGALAADFGNFVGAGRRALVIEGDVIPAPSALALLGLAGLMTPRRRRGEK